MTWAHMEFDVYTQTSDAVLDSNGFISLAGGFETPVGASLFSNARALKTDGEANRGGYWGDTYSELEGQIFGSRFWVFRNQGITLRSMRELRSAGESCLSWMIALGITQEIVVSVERLGTDSAKISLSSKRPDGSPWAYVWEVHQNALR